MKRTQVLSTLIITIIFSSVIITACTKDAAPAPTAPPIAAPIAAPPAVPAALDIATFESAFPAALKIPLLTIFATIAAPIPAAAAPPTTQLRIETTSKCVGKTSIRSDVMPGIPADPNSGTCMRLFAMIVLTAC